MSAAKPAVLFLCTGNSARSQLGEALLRELAGARFDVRSAGTEPKGVHPLTRSVLAERGIDGECLRSKTLAQALEQGPLPGGRLEHAFLVCAQAEQRCPQVGSLARHVHAWPFEDPAAEQGDEPRRLAAFRAARDAIEARLRAWLATLDAAARAEA